MVSWSKHHPSAQCCPFFTSLWSSSSPRRARAPLAPPASPPSPSSRSARTQGMAKLHLSGLSIHALLLFSSRSLSLSKNNPINPIQRGVARDGALLEGGVPLGRRGQRHRRVGKLYERDREDGVVLLGSHRQSQLCRCGAGWETTLTLVTSETTKEGVHDFYRPRSHKVNMW